MNKTLGHSDAVVGVYLNTPIKEGGGQPRVALLAKIDLGKDIRGVQKNHRWKTKLREDIAGRFPDVEIQSVSMLAKVIDGCSIAISCIPKRGGLEAKRKATSLRGRELGRPTKGRTMAAKRRGK